LWQQVVGPGDFLTSHRYQRSFTYNGYWKPGNCESVAGRRLPAGV